MDAERIKSITHDVQPFQTHFHKKKSFKNLDATFSTILCQLLTAFTIFNNLVSVYGQGLIYCLSEQCCGSGSRTVAWIRIQNNGTRSGSRSRSDLFDKNICITFASLAAFHYVHSKVQICQLFIYPSLKGNLKRRIRIPNTVTQKARLWMGNGKGLQMQISA
jgi:hypothetical protein